MYYNKVGELCFEEGERMADKKLKITIKKYQGETSVISLRLPIELVNTLDELAKETGRTRNDIMQRCLEFSIDNLEITDKECDN